ncbi:OmpA family protein [Hyphomonas sp. WL0036]|nr:OmpA family protein [Hyphomonas sediminis]
MEDVPAGLAVITASQADYKPASDSRDLIAGETEIVDLQLEPRDEQAEAIGQTLEEAGRIDLYGILFDTNEATLRLESEETLNAVLDALNAREGLAVRITGHTDSVGSDSANQTLSERRAQAVVGWLVDQGIEASRLGASGAGEGRPAASNETEEGRARNRRVELAVRR